MGGIYSPYLFYNQLNSIMKKIILVLASITILTPVSAQDNGEFKVREQSTKTEKKKKEKVDDDEKAFGKGKIVVTAGYGFPNLYKSIFKSLISNGTNSSAGYSYAYDVKGIGPAFIKGDYGITKLIGVGLVLGYSNMTLTETETYNEDVYNSTTGYYETHTYQDVVKYTHTSLSVGARINFHFGTGKKLDPYAGAGIGYSNNQNKFSVTSNNPGSTTTTPVSISGVPVYFAFGVGMRYYFTENIGLYGEIGFDKWSFVQGGLAVKF
jgi:opacity protein-like surface antigen